MDGLDSTYCIPLYLPIKIAYCVYIHQMCTHNNIRQSKLCQTHQLSEWVRETERIKQTITVPFYQSTSQFYTPPPLNTGGSALYPVHTEGLSDFSQPAWLFRVFVSFFVYVITKLHSSCHTELDRAISSNASPEILDHCYLFSIDFSFTTVL